MVGRHAMLSCLLAIALVGCQSYGARLQTSPAGYRAEDASVPDSPYSRTHWKAILLSGDNSIRAFDNAVRDLAVKFRGAGIEVVAILSPTSKERPRDPCGPVAPNRILFSAASELRKSFGCRSERLYTYYNGCFIQQFRQQFGRARTWEDLYAAVNACVRDREAKLQELPSEPQAFFGRLMKNLPLPITR
jgi:hypothetical protein